MKWPPPKNEKELLERCHAIEGLTFAQLATKLQLTIPLYSIHRKGFIGQLIELALGAEAGSRAVPDFQTLGIELKTVPINTQGKTIESTFVTSIPLLTIHQQTWEKSTCFAKLKRVLWLPIEGDKSIEFANRRVGHARLWSPNASQEKILKNDWQELTELITTGQLATIHAGMGQYLQIRPKAAHAKSLCHAYDEQGVKILTLPRGFYLRQRFTSSILV